LEEEGTYCERKWEVYVRIEKKATKMGQTTAQKGGSKTTGVNKITIYTKRGKKSKEDGRPM